MFGPDLPEPERHKGEDRRHRVKRCRYKCLSFVRVYSLWDADAQDHHRGEQAVACELYFYSKGRAYHDKDIHPSPHMEY